MTKTIIISIIAGYLLSWIIHGSLIKRLKNTRHYYKRGYYSLYRSWEYAGRTL